MHFIKIIRKTAEKNVGFFSFQRGGRHVKSWSRISEMCWSLLAKQGGVEYSVLDR